MAARCITCKHWTRLDPDSFEGRLLKDWPAGKCDSDIFENPPYGTPSEGALFNYWDAEGYCAGFETHESFGCVGHELE